MARRRPPPYRVERDPREAEHLARGARAFADIFGLCSICGAEAHGREFCTQCAEVARLMTRARSRAHGAGRACPDCEGAAFVVGFAGFESCTACNATGIQGGLPLVTTLTETVSRAAERSMAQMSARRHARERARNGNEAA